MNRPYHWLVWVTLATGLSGCAGAHHFHDTLTREELDQLSRDVTGRQVVVIPVGAALPERGLARAVSAESLTWTAAHGESVRRSWAEIARVETTSRMRGAKVGASRGAAVGLVSGFAAGLLLPHSSVCIENCNPASDDLPHRLGPAFAVGAAASLTGAALGLPIGALWLGSSTWLRYP